MTDKAAPSDDDEVESCDESPGEPMALSPDKTPPADGPVGRVPQESYEEAALTALLARNTRKVDLKKREALAKRPAAEVGGGAPGVLKKRPSSAVTGPPTITITDDDTKKPRNNFVSKAYRRTRDYFKRQGSSDADAAAEARKAHHAAGELWAQHTGQ